MLKLVVVGYRARNRFEMAKVWERNIHLNTFEKAFGNKQYKKR